MPSVVHGTQHFEKPFICHLEAWVLCFRRGKVTRGHVGALFKLGLWLGPTRVIMTERVQQWSGSVHETTRQVGVVWISHGKKLTRSHLTQLRRCSEREVAIASLEGLIPVTLSTSVADFGSWTIRGCVVQFAESMRLASRRGGSGTSREPS